MSFQQEFDQFGLTLEGYQDLMNSSDIDLAQGWTDETQNIIIDPYPSFGMPMQSCGLSAANELQISYNESPPAMDVQIPGSPLFVDNWETLEHMHNDLEPATTSEDASNLETDAVITVEDAFEKLLDQGYVNEIGCGPTNPQYTNEHHSPMDLDAADLTQVIDQFSPMDFDRSYGAIGQGPDALNGEYNYDQSAPVTGVLDPNQFDLLTTEEELANDLIAFTSGEGYPGDNHQRASSYDFSMVSKPPVAPYTAYHNWPQPPTDNSDYNRKIGWYEPVEEPGPGVSFRAKVGFYHRLDGQPPAPREELDTANGETSGPATTKSKSKSKKRKRTDSIHEATQTSQEQHNSASTVVVLSQTAAEPRASRTDFPRDLAKDHPVTKYKGEFKVPQICSCNSQIVIDARPLNAFMSFRRDYNTLARTRGSEPQPDISCRASAAWYLVDAQTRARYKQMYEKAVAEHKKRNPRYKYTPKAQAMKKFGFKDCFCGAFQYNSAAIAQSGLELTAQAQKRLNAQ